MLCCASLQIRAAVFVQLVDMVGRCMATRHVVPRQNLWRTAAAAFNAVVVAGLPAVNMAHVDGLSTDQAWDTLATALEVFLLACTEPETLPVPPERGLISSIARAFAIGDQPQPAKQQGDSVAALDAASLPQMAEDTVKEDTVTAEQASQDIELEVSVMDTLTDTLLTSCPYASDDMQRRLVLIVDRCRFSQTMSVGCACHPPLFSLLCGAGRL